MKLFRRVPIAVVLVVFVTLVVSPAASDELTKQASWRIPTDAEVRTRMTAWLAEEGAEQSVHQAADDLWTSSGQADAGWDRLDGIANTIALHEPRAARLAEACRNGATPDTLLLARWLDDKQVAPIVRDNLKLLLGRSLVQGDYFDEATQQLDGLQPDHVLDPAALLFYQGATHHRLVHREKGLVAIDRLLENEDQIPRRFNVLARLMRADLVQLKDGSLDDVSRHMKDVQRRLGLGRAGQRVREVEDQVIDMLDKLIKEAEDKQSQSAGGGTGGTAQSSQPAKDSGLGGRINAPGKIAKRDIGKTAGWGDLPPKEREEAMQEIGRDFPAHYREVVEEYFRELAKHKK